MAEPGDRFESIEEEFGWDDPRERSSAWEDPRPLLRPPEPASAVERPPPPPERPRAARRTLAGDLRRLAAPATERNGPLVLLVTLAVGLAAAYLIFHTAGRAAAPATPAAVKSTPVTISGLRRGSRGDSVRRLQESLAAVGLVPGGIDAVFGPATETALASFQRSHGLDATGVADTATGKELAAVVVEQSVPEASTVRRGLAEAVGSARIPQAAAARYSASLTLAATAISELGGTKGATLSVVLHDVAVQTSSLDEPRALALFGMLDANRRYLARNDVKAERQDIEDADGVVYRYYTGHGFQFQPLADFSHLNALVTAGDAERAHRLAKALVARGIPENGALLWEYFFPYQGPANWRSGFAQAIAAQALARTAELAHDDALLAAAHRAFRAIPGTLSMSLGGGLWIKEYSFSDSPILNAQLQSLVSLTDYAGRAHAGDVNRVVYRMDAASRTLLPQFDTGCWSRYSLGGSDADLHYHTYHVQLLHQLASKRPDAIWRATGERWARFFRNRALPCGQR